MRIVEHETCSVSSPALHVRFSARRVGGLENGYMANGDPTDPVGLEMGRRIRSERAARKWTQEDLAKATGWRQSEADEGTAKGLSPSRIANYEQGTRRIDNEEAEILASIFGLPSAYFLGVVNDHEARVLQALRATPPPRAASRPR